MIRAIATSLALTSVLATASIAQAQETEASALESVLAAPFRSEDAPRDAFRNPAETLAFFGITQEMTVGEYSPGGGWYTRVLAPYLAGNGQYVALGADVDRYLATADEDRRAQAKQSLKDFPETVAGWTGLDASLIKAVEIDEAPDEMAESLDAVLIFRSMHGLVRRGMGDSVARDSYGLLKPGGVVGVVQHRAKEDAAYSYTRGHNGYIKPSELIAVFESEGFELVGTSDINANAKDPANHEGGVWTLPPTLRFGEENKDTYLAIGESDRMTLLFRKPS